MTQAISYNPSDLWRLPRVSAPDGLGMIHHLINSMMRLVYLPRCIRGHEARSPLSAQLSRFAIELKTGRRLGNLRKMVICRLKSGPFNVPGFSDLRSKEHNLVPSRMVHSHRPEPTIQSNHKLSGCDRATKFGDLRSGPCLVTYLGIVPHLSGHGIPEKLDETGCHG